MKGLWCRIVGHEWTAVSEAGLVARPGGMLPVLDGFVAYKPDPDGDHRACVRCRLVRPAEGRR